MSASSIDRDTDRAARRIVVERLRAMSISEKVTMVNSLNRQCDALALAGLQERYPADTSADLQVRLHALRLGPELAEQVFGRRLPGSAA